jgi:hypothetical protein
MWSRCELKSFPSSNDLISHLNQHLFDEEERQTPNVCLWYNCGKKFDSFTALTVSNLLTQQHLDEIHIGQGKSSYVCQWFNCPRNGKPMEQRQKIMRHLQTRIIFLI